MISLLPLFAMLTTRVGMWQVVFVAVFLAAIWLLIFFRSRY